MAVLKFGLLRSLPVLALVISAGASAGNIAYGKVVGVQTFDSAQDKLTRIIFDGAASNAETAKCKGTAPTGESYIYADIKHDSHSAEAIAQMSSAGLAAYATGKKVRAYSYTNDSCEADMVSIQDFYL